jgi:serine/threonine protein kinase
MSEERQPGAALVGAVLSNSYEITRLIGQGGMGAVYEGRHLRLGQRIAIKVMAGDLATSREALARFRREAEITSQIRHPHIVHVFDFGSARSGEPFLVMEYLDGEDLDHRISRLGHLPPAAAVHIVMQTAAALAAAHAKGIVHRDLKPANIFLLELEGEADFVKVVDFGISKVKAATTKLTRSSVVMGTPDYMSPEQARGKVDEIDHRTDQWALAAITYEMLCGRPPFAGDDVGAVLYQVTREDPEPLSKRVRGLPSGMEAVVARALSKRPGDRFPSIVAFSKALSESTSAATTYVTPTAPSRPSRSAQQKATVAYGRGPTRDQPAPDTLEDAPETFGDATTVDPPALGRPPRELKRTTFSQATGEAAILVHRAAGLWTRRWALPVVAISLGLLFVVIVRGLRRGSVDADPAQIVRSSTPAVRPTIAPLEAKAPLFVGPPAPPAAAAAAKTPTERTRTGQRLLDPTQSPLGDRLANPFEEDAVPARPGRKPENPRPDRAVEGAPAPTPSMVPAPQPTRPARRIIKEL